MSITTTLTGNDAVAEAMRQIDPDVVSAFPITPQTELMHKFAEYVADGKAKAEMILVESEHSAMSAAVGAASAGVRVMTATSACGLALMFEILYVASGCRYPIVMALINRAFSAPINIHCDHSDVMASRESGWIQLFSENSQEAYDNTLQAIRIAEHKDVQLPVMINLDGFILSHTMERLDILDDDVAKKFVGEYIPRYSILDVEHPRVIGSLDLPDYYFEHKRQQAEAMKYVPNVVLEVGKEYEKISGRKQGLLEAYRTDDAEIIMVALGSTTGTMKVVVDELRENGEKVGLLKPRLYRPFPYKEIVNALKSAKVVATFDRYVAFGAFGSPLFSDIRSALYNSGYNPIVVDFIYGLGGRDIDLKDFRSVYSKLKDIAKSGKEPEECVSYIGVRE